MRHSGMLAGSRDSYLETAGERERLEIQVAIASWYLVRAFPCVSI